jgi:hypothetical protein
MIRSDFLPYASFSLLLTLCITLAESLSTESSF